MINFERKTVSAKEIWVTVDKEVEDYALDLLNIFNNAREYPDRFLKIGNDSTNNIWVLTPLEGYKEMEDYLEYFGDIIEVNDRVVHLITPVYDNDGWKKLYSDDTEAVMLIKY